MNRPKGNRFPNRSVFVLLVILYSLSTLGSSARSRLWPKGNDALRILFVGNSYTYYNSMPEMVRAMGEHAFPGRAIETQFTGRGGATLKQHWESGIALKEIETGRWDYVVLQEQSMLGTAVVENGERYIGSPEPFFTYARRFGQAIKRHGGEPVFFMTWSRENQPEQQKYLTYAYMSIARELGAKVAPVGMVWDSLRTVDGLDLYQKDGSHPTIHGSYLASVTLFAVIFNTTPAGIPGRLEGREILRGGKLSDRETLLCDVQENEARIIQNAAAGIVEKMRRNNGYLDVEKAISNKRPSLLSRISGVLTSAEGQAVVLVVIVIILFAIKTGLKLYGKYSTTSDTDQS